MKTLIRAMALCLLATAALGARAQTADSGPYLVAAVGGTQYHYDCWFFSDCDAAHATTAKLGGGWRFGVFAVEVWGSDFGRSSINAPPGGSLRVHTAGISGAWYLRFNPVVQGLLRAGAANSWHSRTDDGTKSTLDATFGLGLLVDVAPRVAVELAWDVTGAEGNQTGSVVVNALTAGLRLRF